jgi:hypothetical protein
MVSFMFNEQSGTHMQPQIFSEINLKMMMCDAENLNMTQKFTEIFRRGLDIHRHGIVCLS